MANVPTMEFKRGDGLVHYFQIPVASWVAGGKLWFAAKPAVDNDSSDLAAVINKSFTDAAIVLPGQDEYDSAYVTWRLEFDPADITNVVFSGGESKKRYFGEFEIVPLVGDPESFPSNNQFIDTIIYADIKRGVA